MTPYYTDDSVTLYHGDCRDVLLTMDRRSVDCVITDPPYSARTHESTRSNSDRAKGHGNRVLSGSFGFDSITLDDLRAVMETLGGITRGWVVSSLDYHHAFALEQSPPDGLRMLRIGVWVKPNPMPQISGDRPGQGWEAIGFLHRAQQRPVWNGGGRSGVWFNRVAQNEGHPTTKPLAMVQDWVTLFTNPGDTILDPFAGSGTTLRAAVNEGRKATGIEIDESYCELIAKRLSQGVLDFGEPA